MFHGVEIKCEICGFLILSFGCCVYPEDLHKVSKSHLCMDCEKAVKDATEQKKSI